MKIDTIQDIFCELGRKPHMHSFFHYFWNEMGFFLKFTNSGMYWYINLFYRDEIFDEMMIESEEEEENNDLELELQTDNANNWKNKFSCEVSNV